MATTTPKKPKTKKPAVPAPDLSHIAEKLRPLAVPIDRLNPDPRNARLHGEENVASIVASYKAFGQRSPIVVQKSGMVIRAGNGRLEAARRLGWTHLAALIVDESDETAQAFALADNRTAETATWDNPVLADLLKETPPELLPATGFDASYLTDLLETLNPPTITEDEAPAPLKAAVSKTGDLWIMGHHRLLCGDSTKAEDVERVIAGKCDVCLTDPPYGCGESYESHDDTQDALRTLAQKFFALAITRCEVVGLTPGIGNIQHYPAPKWVLCWWYGVGTGRSPWGFSCWQPMLVYGADPYLARGLGCHPDGVNMLMTRDDAAQNRAAGHPCPKPLSVWGWFLERLAPQTTQTIYEPFSGSGTTIIASEQLHRKCRAIEIEPLYVDVAIRRWERLTGETAHLEGTDQTWANVAKARGVQTDAP